MTNPRTPFVVTGCSRSGTRYASRLLSRVGFSCGHERIFEIGRTERAQRGDELFRGVGKLQGDASFLAVPFLDTLPPGTVVLHQLRDPLEVIRSHAGIRFFAHPFRPSPYLAENHPAFLAFLARHCPEIFRDDDEISCCMRYWVAWNRLAARAATLVGRRYLRYRLEDLEPGLLRRIAVLLGAEADASVLEDACRSVSRSLNSRPREESVTWATLPRGRDRDALAEAAREYGYEVPGS